MKKLQTLFQRYRQSFLLKRLYKESPFWRIYFTVSENDISGIQELKKLKGAAGERVPFAAFEQYLNYRIAIYLKHMNYAKSMDTQENRDRLLECLEIRDELQRVKKANTLTQS